MIDSHAHYTHKKYDNAVNCLTFSGGKYSVKFTDRSALFDDMKGAGVSAFIEPAIGIDSNYKILASREGNEDFIYPAVGVHPLHTFLTKWKRRKELIGLAEKNGVVAIGETGLDFHYKKQKQHRFLQTIWFIYQLKLAKKKGLPTILHIREADEAALRVLSRFKGCLRGVVHCYNGDALTAQKYLDLGLYIGIGGKLIGNGDRASALAETVKALPLNRLMIETDAPYVLPVNEETENLEGIKKAVNSSSVIFAVAERVAEIKGIAVETVKTASDENVRTLFGI